MRDSKTIRESFPHARECARGTNNTLHRTNHTCSACTAADACGVLFGIQTAVMLVPRKDNHVREKRKRGVGMIRRKIEYRNINIFLHIYNYESNLKMIVNL